MDPSGRRHSQVIYNITVSDYQNGINSSSLSSVDTHIRWAYNVCIMNSVLLSIKTDPETKAQLKSFASELGVTSTSLVNMVIKQAIRDRQITLNAPLIPTPYLEKIMRKADADLATGQNLTTTKSKAEALAHLRSLWQLSSVKISTSNSPSCPNLWKTKAIDAIELFLDNPDEPSLRNHALTEGWHGYRSISVDNDLRVHFKMIDDNTVLFVAIGRHSQLYK